MAKKGSVTFVGTGIQLGRHVSQRVISEIQNAEHVFVMVDGFALDWLKSVRSDVESLHGYYGDNKDRRDTYMQMENRIMEEVRKDKKVVAVFYGHPGVYADVPHYTIEQARSEGYEAHMDPGISADACAYADLGLDPGRRGVQTMEATQFLVYDRKIDPTAMLLLFQVGIVGDLTCTQFTTTGDRLQVLVDKLSRWYSLDTEVILYEAAVIAVQPHREERMTLRDLPKARTEQITTLVIPPQGELEPDHDSLKLLGVTAADLA